MLHRLTRIAFGAALIVAPGYAAANPDWKPVKHYAERSGDPSQAQPGDVELILSRCAGLFGVMASLLAEQPDAASQVRQAKANRTALATMLDAKMRGTHEDPARRTAAMFAGVREAVEFYTLSVRANIRETGRIVGNDALLKQDLPYCDALARRLGDRLK